MDISKIACFALFGFAIGSSSYADENPSLTIDNFYELSIPSVNYSGIPGFYQNANFEYTPSRQTWQLVGYKIGVPIQPIQTVELIKTQDVPVQIFLKVTGAFSNGCPQVGSAAVAFNNNKFDVYLYYTDESIHPPEPVACTQLVVPFTKVIPLPAYSLPAGQYDYNFNGKFTGSFTLNADNKLQ